MQDARVRPVEQHPKIKANNGKCPKRHPPIFIFRQESPKKSDKSRWKNQRRLVATIRRRLPTTDTHIRSADSFNLQYNSSPWICASVAAAPTAAATAWTAWPGEGRQPQRPELTRHPQTRGWKALVDEDQDHGTGLRTNATGTG